ncbi:hypothetical protein [Brevundimonas sp. Root1279]|uniref:hypothetical protein n=1 Tax=Brevundimonas sp. Root1279 TaxID=1736443 RepID=UPI000AEE8DFF|nr:hypothetical protein [Brevundimonas sp. Root1279]
MVARAHIADRSVARTAAAPARDWTVEIALTTLILVVALVLLPGAVWMHAT